jgi:hypothetical protein
MHTICIHIDETLDASAIETLKRELLHVPHVSAVFTHPRTPHDVAVEFEERRNMPMTILSRLSRRGLHSDLQPC